MAEVMSRVRTLSRFFAWIVLVATAFLAADLVSAAVERSIQVTPAPIGTAAPAPVARPPQTGGGLQVVLRQPNAEPPTRGPNGRRGAGEEGEAAPAPPPNMTLRGTLLGGGASIALIETGGQVQAVGLGDTISGFKLARVESTWVGLKGDTQNVELALETTQLREGRSAPERPLPGAASVPSPPAPLPAPADVAVVPGASGERLSAEDIRAILDKPGDVAKTFRVVPISRENEPYGVQIEFRQQDNLMAKFGLQHGDVLLSLNGQPIRNAEDVYKAYLAIRNSPSLEFEVDRGGTVVPVQYELAR